MRLSISGVLIIVAGLSLSWPLQARQNTGSLSRQDRLQLEASACQREHGQNLAQVQGWTMEQKNAAASYADVKCRPHAKMINQPLYWVTQCVREGQEWGCSPAELETLVPVRFGAADVEHKLEVRPGSVSPEKAYLALQQAAKYGYFQGYSLQQALQSPCNMGMGERPDLVEVSCKEWTISISFWCPQQAKEKTCPRIIYMAPKK